MVYVGLSYYGPALGSEEHVSFLFSSLAEIPSYFACWIVMDRWGRRWPLCLCMVTAGLSCVATVLLPSGIINLLPSQLINVIVIVKTTNYFIFRCCGNDIDFISFIKISNISFFFDYLSVCW